MGYELVLALDAPVLQIVDLLVDVLQFFDTFLLVVTKVVLEDSIPKRTALPELQPVEQLVEVPTVSFVEQTVDNLVQSGGGRRGELQGQSSSEFSGA